MYFSRPKRSHLIINVSLLMLFLLISLKTSIIVLSSAFIVSNDKKSVESEPATSTEHGKRCSLEDDSCCCEVDVHKNLNCCCKSDVPDIKSVNLAAKQSTDKIFETIIGSIKCSHSPGNFQTGVLSDYELRFPNAALFILEISGFQIFPPKSKMLEPHLFIPAKPPRTIS